MKRKFKSKAVVFFSIMFVLLLFIAGCASDSSSPNSPSDQNTDGDVAVDSTLADFIGTWDMWEQRGYTDLSCGQDSASASEQIEYNIRIEQTGNQARLYLFGDESQSLSCELDGNELACQGAYNWGDGWSITYDDYRIYFIGVGHTELKGEVTWTISYNDATCSGTSGIDNVNSTGQPGDGHPGGGDGSGGAGEDTYTDGCTNGSDDDGDSDIDCDDSDCAGDSACTDGGGSGVEICNNRSDDDGDGDIDCDDSDCAGDSACTGGGLVCASEGCSEVCSGSNCSSCVTRGTCNSVCNGSHCDYQCGGNGTQCNFVCRGSGCNMLCQDSAHCNMVCYGRGCQMTCAGDADCDMACPGGDCDITCATTGTCNRP